MIVVAIIGLLSAMSYVGFQSLINSARSRNFVNDFSSQVAAGRLRALAREAPVLFIIDTNSPPQYWELDDRNLPPVMTTTAAVAAAASAFATNQANYNLSNNLASGNSFILLNQSVGTDTPVVSQTNAWKNAAGANSPFPFPFGATSTNTTNGCTFCTAKRGAVAFLPDGRAILSDGSTSGAVVFARKSDQAPTTNVFGSLNAVLISSPPFAPSLVETVNQ